MSKEIATFPEKSHFRACHSC